MQDRVQAHVVYRLEYHIVWVTKYRKKLLAVGVGQYLKKIIVSYLADKYPDCYLEDYNFQEDHIHGLYVIPPKYSIAKIVQDVKSNSSRELRKRFEFLNKYPHIWSIGYYVSSIGADEKRIKNYIEYQGKQDRGQAQLALL